MAVDVYTYDLLHIAIYAHNAAISARAFLLAFKDQRLSTQESSSPTCVQEYVPSYMYDVFPPEPRHECIFHAMKSLQN